MIVFRVKETATGRKGGSSREIYESIKELAQADQESFWIIGYNVKFTEIFRKCLFLGGISHAYIDNKIIFNRLLLRCADSWAAVHNHPSGDSSPSSHDIALTRNLVEASGIIGLKMLDHIIIGDKGYFSFADHGGYGLPQKYVFED